MKILVVRFSSIGDIVLTTPVVRSIKSQIKNVELHYLTKHSFRDLLKDNPHIDKLIVMESNLDALIPSLKAERYDLIVDLHHNLRTFLLTRKLKVPAVRFPKLNLKKWLLVRFKWNVLPELHVVDRYYAAVASLGVRNDSGPCEFQIHPSNTVDLTSFGLPHPFVAIAIGAQFHTKRMPKDLLSKLIEHSRYPVVLIGGATDQALGAELKAIFPANKVHDLCGKLTIQQSADVVRQSVKLVTNDTGMMHIASCFDVPIVSVWGNTVPAFGMYPYRPGNGASFSMHEVHDLSCRPCSKIGYDRCPKGHFKCMALQDVTQIAEAINS